MTGDRTKSLSAASAANAFTLKYDAWNRLVKVTRQSTSTVLLKMEYDGLGRRIQKVVPTVVGGGRGGGTTLVDVPVDYYYNEEVSVPSTAGRPSVFYVNPAGEAISSGTLARQGTSHLAGNFQGLAGASVDDIVSRVPAGWTSAPQRAGNGLRFFDEAGFERLRLHGPSARAPVGSNSQSGWTLRIMDRTTRTTGNYYDDAGRIVRPNANEGHIPIYGNPNAP